MLQLRQQTPGQACDLISFNPHNPSKVGGIISIIHMVRLKLAETNLFVQGHEAVKRRILEPKLE